MTVFFELQTLIKSLREGNIPITEVLQRICNDEAIREQTKDLMREPHIFDEGVPGWLAAIFGEQGLSQEEIAHAGSWPTDQKEALRAEISFAYDSGQPISFAWDISHDAQPAMDVQRGANGEARVVFLSPRVALEESGSRAN